MSNNSRTYLITFGLLSLLASGCSSDAPKPVASPSASPSASAQVPIATPVASASPVFTQPLVTPKPIDQGSKVIAAMPSPSGDVAAGLIPITDTDVATRAVPKGRTDPFAAVIMQSVVTNTASRVIPTNSAPNPVTNAAPAAPVVPAVVNRPVRPVVAEPNTTAIGKIGKVGSNLGAASIAELAKKSAAAPTTKVAIAPKAIPNAVVTKVNSTQVGPALVPVEPGKTALRTLPSAAPAPQPELSKAILVSGISEINGQTQVIVKLPGEAFSRYLSVGERVLNGKVLIKRVQDRSAVAPIVVLEEVGVEVYRRVGEKPLVAVKEGGEPAK